MVLWLMGISGAGKTTIGRQLQQYMNDKDVKNYLIDGDEIRALYDNDLGFSVIEREQNIKRIIGMAYVLDKCGITVIVCNISPFERLRNLARGKIKGYNEIFLKRDYIQSSQADVKGVYRENIGKTELIGKDIQFDEPQHPDLVIDTTVASEAETLQKIIEYYEEMS